MRDVLEEARALGFLGPGPVGTHIRHAEGFRDCVPGQPRRVMDMGSGGGVPGLVLAGLWPEARFVLLDSNRRRVDFLRGAVRRLGLEPRVATALGRAEEAGRDAGHRGVYDLVVARSFGPPAVVAECAAPFLQVMGRLVVSEPPSGSGERWPERELAVVGLRPEGLVDPPAGRFQVLGQIEPCPERFPRRPGIPAKRPLF